jgi:glutaredoxin
MYNSIKLTIYTQNDCGYCHELKRKLDSWGYNFDEINISYQIERKVFLKELNLSTVPQLFWNGKHVGPANNDTLGFTKEMLEAELNYYDYIGGVENFA